MAAPNVWTQMNYVPPRGQCNFKQSVLSPKCPCLRFMLHPLKSASSYECDGCNHHASFHSMENKAEDEIKKRWEQEAKDKADREEEAQQRPKKRVRAIEYQQNPDQLQHDEMAEALGFPTAMGKTAAKGRLAAKKKTGGGRVAAGKARGRVTEILEDEEDEVVELD
ncbi:hypothetical protein CC86DRAFT_379074 [Ophiobolus disseminans]|uniref:Uncharacterized protein n=1 Tax=Ophiobolus disseminans TaxID=1469910 RepID=A0A6A7AC12_9PLEO|nr:hypothetical protein CC86DRAFT_379074 [Ophiobolus disseminans]